MSQPAHSQTSAFFAILRRDLYVTWRELPAFLAQVILQPLFLLFVFGKVLGSLGYTTPGYADLLFPGLLALTAVITGHAGTGVPARDRVRLDEGDRGSPARADQHRARRRREGRLRDRSARSPRTTLMIPIGILVLGSIPWRWSALPLFLAVLVLASVLGACLGLVLGTAVKPAKINIVFSLVFTPLLFTGCSQYPWPSLDQLRWFQVVTAANPMTYASEGLRAALVPSVPHIAGLDLPDRASRRDRRTARDRRARLLPPRHRLVATVEFRMPRKG